MSHLFRKDPILITGVGHSGTRGLVQVLRQSEELYLGDISHHKREWEFYRVLAAEVNAILLGLPMQHDHNLIPPEVYYSFRPDPIRYNKALSYASDRIRSNLSLSMPPNQDIPWLIKTPRTVLCLGLWKEIFPDMKILNLIRDGRDVALSLPKNAGSLERRFELWRARLFKMEKDISEAIKIYSLRYEDLNSENELKKLCEFLEIEFVQNMVSTFNPNYGKGVKKFLKIRHYEKYELLKYGYFVK